jgi:hypothetical protein
MTFILSLLLLTSVLAIFAYQISLHNSVASDRFRFEYFALRDRLNLLVARGKIREESLEYRTFMGAINFHIHAVESVSIMRMASVIAGYHTTTTGSRKVEVSPQLLLSDETKKLMFDFLTTTEKLLRRNSRAQMWLYDFINKKRIVVPSGKVRLHVSRPQAALNKILESKRQISGDLPHDFACA